MARNGLGGLLGALISVLSPRPAARTSAKKSSGAKKPQASLRAKPNQPAQQSQPAWKAAEAHGEPGQFGPGATRDLPRSEIARLTPSYTPNPDGDPDPGEVVWTWVPFVENDGRGKDRPVLIIASIDAQTTAGCYLSTKYHDGFIEVGTGGWDPQGRESYLNPERILRITHEGMRREGHVLPEKRFRAAVHEIGAEHGQRW